MNFRSFQKRHNKSFVTGQRNEKIAVLLGFTDLSVFL